MFSFSLRVMWKRSLNVKHWIIKLTKLVSKFCSTFCQHTGSPCNLVKQLLTTGKLWMQRQSPLLVRWKGLFITSRAVHELLMYRPLSPFLTPIYPAKLELWRFTMEIKHVEAYSPRNTYSNPPFFLVNARLRFCSEKASVIWNLIN